MRLNNHYDTAAPLQNQDEFPARGGSVPVPPSPQAVFTQQSGVLQGHAESVLNMQPASMVHDEVVESPRVDEEDGNE